MSPNFGYKLWHRPRLHQRCPDRITKEVVYYRLLAEADLGLRRMHIHIHLGIWHFKEQQHHREDCRRKNVANTISQGVLDQPVANQSAIYKRVYRVAIQFLDLGLRDKSMQ